MSTARTQGRGRVQAREAGQIIVTARSSMADYSGDVPAMTSWSRSSTTSQAMTFHQALR